MSSNTSVKFLLVDDMEENLLALEGLLRRDGLEILKARSGSEALELLLDENDVGLAILDVQMPEMDGFELAELMRGSSRTKHVPIIFLTAAGFDDPRRFRGYEAGAVDFLSKPIEPVVLKGKADVFYDLSAQRQEVIRQRDELRLAAAENARLYLEILRLNESLEERVKERTSQLLEANEQLQGFTYSVAHDFRQHIRGISINASLLLEEAGDLLGKHRSNVERVRDVAHLMGQMTNDLLTYARLRRDVLNVTDLDVSALAEASAESYSTLYPTAKYHIAPDLHGRADRTMMRIVLDNLLGNAFKYSQHSEHPMIEVGAEPQGFYVRDNGIGFDMAYVHKLFQPFERLNADGRFGGTGMGLANVQRILDRHGGKVWAESVPDHGATFHVSLSRP